MAIVGEQFQTYVSDQINKRQKIHGKENRSVEDLQYLNSKTAWVKLASGVSLKGDERIKDLGWNGIGQGTDLAKKYVLFGGTSFKSDNSTTLQQLEGFKTYQVWRNTYNVNAKQQKENLDFGFVPPPGIESVDVKNMNRGSIKKATVKIKAYSRDQFDILDILYMRLGYTVLLEWGWSHYISNDKKIEQRNDDGSVSTTIEKRGVEQMGYTLIEAENGFFSTTAKSHRQFLNKISEYRKSKSGNYDGLLAKISNFDWTFNPDGSYDITLTLISLGDVIESLKTNVSPKLTNLQEEDKPKDILSEYLYIWKKSNNNISPNKTIYYYIPSAKGIGYFVEPPLNNLVSDIYKSEELGFLDQFNIFKIFDLAQEKIKEFKDKKYNIEWIQFYGASETDVLLFKSQNPDVKFLPTQFTWVDIWFEIKWSLEYDGNIENIKDIIYFDYISENQEEGETNIGQNNLNYYMNFGHLLSKVVEFCIPVNNNGEEIIGINTKGDMLYYPNQISFDPRICIVKGEIDNNIIFPQLKEWRNENVGVARIENIYINFSTIQNAIDSNLDENNKLALVPFLQSICNDLNRALGGINNLEPIVDEDNNTLNIIDGSYISDNAYKTPYGLEVFGYNPAFKSSNFVRNLDLKTQITPEYASMVTIGATAGGYVKGTEATIFSKWNKGIVDRFKEEYLPPSSTPQNSTTNSEEPKTNYIKYLQSGEKILGLNGEGNNILDDTVIDSNLSIVEEYYKYLNYIAQKEQDTFSSSTNGFIPFNLGITMDGISGIKIYNKLNVSTRFLPKNYPDSLHFIIKGVSHKISNQDWETTLETTVVPNSFIDPSKIINRPQITTSTQTIGASTGAAGAAGIVAGASAGSQPSISNVDDNQRFWTLVAICSREDNNPQGYADVAQSIYNRNLGGRNIGYRSDIVDQILANSQYEPTWRFPVFRTEYKANIEWFNIKDIQTASIATGLPISTLQKVVEALKNPTLQQNARNFIKGRTDFLGSNQPASRMKQKIQRNSNNNKFGFNWGWNPANGGNAAPIPSYVTNINV